MNKNTLKEKIYKLMDSFLVEGDNPRPIDRLNQDRHLFVENLLALFSQTFSELIGEEELVQESLIKANLFNALILGKNELRRELRNKLSEIVGEEI